jgi:hypothetical protein
MSSLVRRTVGHMQGYKLTALSGFDLLFGDELGILSVVRADMHM